MTPKTEAELAEMVAQANGPMRIIGGGTRPIGKQSDGTVLSTSKLSGVELYEPGALTLVAKAGTPVAKVEKTLAKEGQRLAFEPMDHRGLLGTKGEPTIGGVFAANVSGPRRIQTGAARDFLLGVRFVDGTGQVLRNGGRVMKNVTGYDLVKLMAGSYGTLGVMTEVSLKVLPKSRHTGVLLMEGLDDADAVKALSRTLASPFEVTGAAHLQKGRDDAPVTMIRIEGFENSVAYRAEALQKILAPFGAATLETDEAKTTAGWRYVRDVEPFHDTAGDVWRISVKPSDAPGLVAQIDGAEAIYDWGGGLIWLLVPEGTKGAAIREAMKDTPGHATLIRGDAGAGAFQPLSPAMAALQDGLRARFDPKGLFNPGLMDRAA
ncbi:glycolate oxidase subunit GlcE [Roseovarius aestuariivivens]|uniref:glycolate oxidase subunit GlcE n=1 Tax=Roseovarius aestuariivivens TaxID=1888910 RepID=UPI001081B391|nr:glycolate oxidase subunit GlcE [Roseovarius aestuariivivens]